VFVWVQWCPTHIVLCFCFVFLHLVYPMLKHLPTIDNLKFTFLRLRLSFICTFPSHFPKTIWNTERQSKMHNPENMAYQHFSLAALHSFVVCNFIRCRTQCLVDILTSLYQSMRESWLEKVNHVDSFIIYFKGGDDSFFILCKERGKWHADVVNKPSIERSLCAKERTVDIYNDAINVWTDWDWRHHTRMSTETFSYLEEVLGPYLK
jgi:hypothetical protein